MAANYSRSDLNTTVANMVSGTFSDSDFNEAANRAVRKVLGDIDMISAKRKSELAPNLFDDVFQYTCPTDLKERKIIDIQPQINRGRLENWNLVSQEEFDRYKKEYRLDRFGDPIDIQKSEDWLGTNLVAVSDDDMARKLLLSRPVDDDEIAIDMLDSVGDWEGFGDGTNLTKDSSNYVEGSASINWDIDDSGGTTAGIQNSSLTSFDISDYLTEGAVFVWVYLSDSTDVTNFICRVGSSSSAYYSITVTTNNEGNSFEDGWNLLRFPFSSKTETGTVDDDACDYVALYMTKDSGKTDETDYRFDEILIKKGEHYYVVYYSKYGWQTSAGSWQEESSNDTDLLNADTTEYEIIAEKTAELVEGQVLRNREEAEVHKREYELAKEKYQSENPSEALPLLQTYYDM